MDEYFIKCVCGCQMLQAECRLDYDDDKMVVYFTIWNRGRDGKKICGWKEKFRWCWNIIKTGSTWADDIIATNKDARGLAQFILQNTPDEK